MANKKPNKACSDCIHFHACQSWTSGILDDTDARPCRNYETVRDSNAYYLGQVDADKRNKVMKPEKVTDDVEIYKCPVCGETLFSSCEFQFCNVCGQALDWSEQEG